LPRGLDWRMLKDMKLAAVLLVAVSSVAHADGLTARFGMTFSPFADEAVPDDVHEVGPLIAIGDRLGPFVGEVEWSYLSLFDPEASPEGVHRLGVTLRADVWRNMFRTQCSGESSYAGHCTHAKGLYVEGGAAERFGRWVVRPTEQVPATSPQPEVHVGFGLEMDNQVWPNRNGWQLGIRLSMARGDAALPVACRTTSGTCSMTASSGVERAVFVEWMFLVGH
jgi:hypothetical protein